MFITLFNSHALTNQILIIVLEGTYDTKTTQNTLFRLFKTCFSNFYVIFEFLSQNTLNTLKNSKKQHLKLWWIKPYEFASKHFRNSPTLKSNIVLNVKNHTKHKQTYKQQLNILNMAECI